jgi:hypothetical protein
MNRGWKVLLIALGATMVTSVAAAKVRREGAWPDAENAVSLDVEATPRTQAVRKLADAAGWSVIVNAPPGDPVDMHVKNESPAKLLDVLLSDADYVATRDGNLISITKDTAKPAAPLPAPTAEEQRRGEDRTVTGGDAIIAKDEVVHDLMVLGGKVQIHGVVTGDLSVTGGAAHLFPGARVRGDASVMGGEIRAEDEAAIDGDISIMGGALVRGRGAKIGGAVVTKGGSQRFIDGSKPSASEGGHTRKQTKFGYMLGEVGSSITAAALLFVFGAVLLALGGPRMEMLRQETAARPMRSFALGVVGSIAAVILAVALCIVIVGIPVVIIGLLVGVFAVYASICAVLTVVGEALIKHKTKNPYVHLALGCLLFLVLGAIPFVGGFIKAAVTFIAIGTLVATRGCGYFKKKVPPAEGPYRTAGEA